MIALDQGMEAGGVPTLEQPHALRRDGTAACDGLEAASVPAATHRSVGQQDRVADGWKDYTLYKFRSMVKDAEEYGAKWAEEDDPRVTRVGRVIRRYRIDELPQLFNVLKGDMSFVGPRPERRLFVEELAEEIPYYPYRLFVKPGISGWAQIKYHYGASKNEAMEKLQYDLYYIKHMSLFFDLSILFDTIRVVLSGKGAR